MQNPTGAAVRPSSRGAESEEKTVEYGLLAVVVGLVIVFAVSQAGVDRTPTYANVGTGSN